MPNQAGKALTFKALQTYSSGEVVRWIGPPDAEEPAPQVTLTASEEEAAGSHAADAEWSPQPPRRGRTTARTMTMARRPGSSSPR